MYFTCRLKSVYVCSSTLIFFLRDKVTYICMNGCVLLLIYMYVCMKVKYAVFSPAVSVFNVPCIYVRVYCMYVCTVCMYVCMNISMCTSLFS